MYVMSPPSPSWGRKEFNKSAVSRGGGGGGEGDRTTKGTRLLHANKTNESKRIESNRINGEKRRVVGV